jgi:hypothetical protein
MIVADFSQMEQQIRHDHERPTGQERPQGAGRSLSCG